MVLQRVYQAGGGAAYRGVRTAQKSWPATYKRSHWHTFLPPEGLYDQTGQLQRRVLHHVVQSELWESLVTAVNDPCVK